MKKALLGTMRALFLMASFGCTAGMSLLSAHLRGTDSFNKSAPTSKEMEKGHFYNADGCEDCFFKGEQCGCEPVVEYFACLTKHCHKATDTAFAEKCAAMSSQCASDLDIDCSGPETVCQSKWHQLPTGGLGLYVKINRDKGFCGPWGKCIGKVVMNVDIYNRPKPPAPEAKVASPAPALPAAPSPAVAVVAPPAAATEPTPPIWLECALEDSKLCQVEVTGDTAKCEVPLFKELEAGGKKKSYCVLTEGKDGKRLTQPHWSMIVNTHEKQNATASGAKEEAKEKKAPKVEKTVAKVGGKTEQAVIIDGPEKPGKPPWMVDKEKQAAERAAEPAKETKEVKKAQKIKVAEKPQTSGSNESKLPWMEGKKNTKPPPPHEQVLKSF